MATLPPLEQTESSLERRLKDPSLLRWQARIGADWVDADDGGVFEVRNPASNDLLARVAACGGAETRRAIQAAADALPGWSARTARERSDILHRLHDLVVEAMDDLATILTAEQGKPFSEARAEIRYGANYIRWFAEEARRISGDTLAPPSPDKRLLCIRQPVGVVACITPWNFPNAMLARKIAPALAAGCTVVFKPANETPLSAFAFAELASRAGVPDGVINGLSGRTEEIGEALTGSEQVRKLTFTGSTSVGKRLLAACAATVKRTSMELGGNAAFIVFDDADIDAAVEGAMDSKFRNSGQTCICANRFLVHEAVKAEFTEKLLAAVSKLRIGDGLQGETDIGPLVSEQASAKVSGLIAEAVRQGGELVTGGVTSGLGGNFIEPTILSGMTPDMAMFSTEIFGPVVPIFSFETEQEALALANDTPFGLANYVYTKDYARIFRVSEGLACGVVGVNEGLVSNETAPFGGVKESGHGREGSRLGIEDYLDVKYICIGGVEDVQS